MKKCKKLLALTMAVLLAFACFALPSFSVFSGSQYGLEATIVTDKESYKANEEIHVTVTVKNTNDFKVEDVSIESLLPETLTLKDGSSSTKTVDLEAGETLTLSFTAVKEKEENSATVPESEGTTPTETETVKPSESETDKPTETETVKPTETETAKPSESETIKPTETQHPSTQESTEQPTQAPTTEKATQPTTAPITTTTAPFTTGETTTLPSTTGTPSTTGGGIIGDLTTTFPKVTTTADSATTAQAENPNTGDSMSVKTLVLAIIALLAVIAVVIILMYKYKKQTTKIISLVMCVAIAATAITGVSFFTAKGADDGRKSFTVEKVITVDGEETKVNADVKYQGNGNTGTIILSSNPKELDTSETPQEILFYIDTKNVKSSYSITVIDGNTNIEVASLLDDGMNGDLQANDGIYSGKITVACDTERTLKYYAILDDGSSKLISKTRMIHIFAPISDKESEEMETVDSRLKTLTESSAYKNSSEQDKINLLKKELDALLSEKLITTYHYDKKSNTYSYEYSNGISGSWSIEPQFEDNDDLLSMGIGESLSPLNARKQLKSREPKAYYGDALILYGLDDPSKENGLMGTYRQIVNEFNSWGLRTALSSMPTVEQLKTLLTEKEYKFIVIEEHGAEIFNEWRTKFVIGLKEKTSSSKNKQYTNDLKSPNPRIIKVEGQYALTPEFFSFYYGEKLDDTIIYLGSCMGFGKGGNEDYSYSSVFLEDCEATNFLGYHNSVYTWYSIEMLRSIVCDLTANKQNIGQAISNASEKWGYNDIEYATNHKNWDKKEIENKKKKYGTAYLVWTGSSKTMLEPEISFAGGKGTINDPYQIATAEQLDAVRYNLNSNFVLVNDIDLSEYENWEPIGGMLDVKASDGFQGTFDGKGHTIKNLKMDYEIKGDEAGASHKWHFGLFSNTQSSPEIKNVNLEDVNISIQGVDSSSKHINIGAITTEASVVTNCSTSGIIRVSGMASNLSIGGIVVQANRIINCKNSTHLIAATDDTNMNIGGIACTVSQALIDNCDNFGNINGFSMSYNDVYCGGIVSYNGGTRITNCNNNGSIEASSYEAVFVGGIVAEGFQCKISRSSNFGELSGRTYGSKSTGAGSRIGGIVADFGGTKENNATISECINFKNLTSISTYSDRNFYDYSWCGGIAGTASIYAKIENCYNLAAEIKAICRNDLGEQKPYIGRICGDTWDSETCLNNYSFEQTIVNGSIPTEDIGPDQKNGGSMTKAEIEKAIQDLGFELPSELPAAS